MNEIKQLEVLSDYRIWLRFQDGTEKTVNIRPLIGNGFTAELLDYEKFRQVEIEGGGGLAWPNGYDICPNFLKDFVADERLESVA